jgi:hypothetical protein
MAIPTPAERPDLYDYPDCRPESNYPEANSDAVTPDYVKQIIAERRKQAVLSNSETPCPNPD